VVCRVITLLENRLQPFKGNRKTREGEQQKEGKERKGRRRGRRGIKSILKILNWLAFQYQRVNIFSAGDPEISGCTIPDQERGKRKRRGERKGINLWLDHAQRHSPS